MKKIIVHILLIIFCILLFQACPKMDSEPDFLNLENYSNDTLAVYVADGLNSVYPDTILPQNYKEVRIGGVNNNEKDAIYWFVNSLVSSPKKFFKRLQKDTLSIFILDANNFSNITIDMDSIWKEMNYGKRFFVRYDLSIQDIEKLDYLLTYPPDNRMRNVRQYPPYNQ